MWPNPHETADLVTFTEKILHGKLYFLCSVWYSFDATSHQGIHLNMVYGMVWNGMVSHGMVWNMVWYLFDTNNNSMVNKWGS